MSQITAHRRLQGPAAIRGLAGLEIMKKLLAALLFVPLVAAAATGTITKTGSFTTLPGYGYEIVGTFDSSVGSFSLSTSVFDDFQFGPREPGIGSGPLGLSATLAPSLQDTQATSGTVSISLQLSIVNLATGETGLPPEFFTPSGVGYGTLYGYHQVTADQIAGVKTSPASELRFSNSSFSVARSFTDGVGNAQPFSRTYICEVGGFNCSIKPPGTLRFDYSVQFQGGHYLAASNDPTCASFSCMVPGQDTLTLQPVSLTFVAQGVPEPASVAMLVAGLACVGLFARRRRG